MFKIKICDLERETWRKHQIPSAALQIDIDHHNVQYVPVEVGIATNAHQVIAVVPLHYIPLSGLLPRARITEDFMKIPFRYSDCLIFKYLTIVWHSAFSIVPLLAVAIPLKTLLAWWCRL